MTADQLRELGAVLPRLEEPGFDFGHWVPSTQREDGVWTMPYFELAIVRRAFAIASGQPTPE